MNSNGREHQLTTDVQGPNETMCTEGFDVGMDVPANACLTFLDNILLVKCVHCCNKALGGFCLWTTSHFTDNSTLFPLSPSSSPSRTFPSTSPSS